MSTPRDHSLRPLALSVLLPGFTGTTLPGWLRSAVAEGLGGVCLFGHNVEGPEQVRALTAALRAERTDVLVASDEEGGSVTRLDAGLGSPWPGAATLGALDDPDATYGVALGLGREARAAGVDLVLAPVLDVNCEPDNPVIGVRSFGATSELVARHGVAFTRGLRDADVIACAKHFPGHGATRTDSHVGLPVLDVDVETWRGRDLPPFESAVAAGVPSIMTAHVVVRALDADPATTSAPVLRILRDDLGFDGAIVSDALDMRAISDGVGRAAGAVRALAAGVDLLCVGNPVFPDGYDEEGVLEEIVDAIVTAVLTGALPRARLEDASRRVAALGPRWAAGGP
ncbi:MAG: glycoside hydrolase family 3 protein, partial [Nocardioidaceae bacterium]|nr:glycoside hydrolase family 3 protein [Nocardioidaceae bacterium]